MNYLLSALFVSFSSLFWVTGIADNRNTEQLELRISPINVKASESGQATFPQIPILCYHQVRNWYIYDSKYSNSLRINDEGFREHVKMLSDSGYHPVLPDQLVEHVVAGVPLPAKPIIITFDDGNMTQYYNAVPILDEYGFKAVFFIMTVTLESSGYIHTKQIKELSDQGHVIGCHTWDHISVTQYKNRNWTNQLEKPKHELETITGKPVQYFAYPYGTWTNAAIEQLKLQGYKAAFQLGGKQNCQEPLFTLRRILVHGQWDACSLDQAIKEDFKRPSEGQCPFSSR